MKISSVIFDLDGTLIDSEKEWGMAYSDVLKMLGRETPGDHPEIRGESIKKNWEIIIKELNLKTNKTLDELEVMTLTSYVNHLSSISLVPGAIEFVENLKDSGVKIGLATLTTWPIVEKIFERLGLDGVFDSITTGEEVVSPKPDPEIFLVEMEKLDEKEENCLVIEDSGAGVTAARLAGMKVIAISRGEDGEKKLGNADLVVTDYADITPVAIEEL